MKVLNYRILLNEEPDGGFTVSVPALPGCITYGADLDQALSMAKEVIETYIEVLKEKGESIPDDSMTTITPDKESATELLGIIGRVPKNFNYKEELFKILEEKYLK